MNDGTEHAEEMLLRPEAEWSEEQQQVIDELALLRSRMELVILGQPELLEAVIITILCGSHALLEGVPGTAKTLAVRTLSRLVGCEFNRIQFTPDLMPADIIGTNVYNAKENRFELRRGPIFTELLLADEINRAPSKTQSSLLEAMAERQATIDGERHQLPDLFSVFATQNPIELEGTYPLPEAQQDRFLMKIRIGHPTLDAERQILDSVHAGTPQDSFLSIEGETALDRDLLLKARTLLPSVSLEPGIRDYILRITRSTRDNAAFVMGAGPRGSICLLEASKARALMKGRSFVTPDDVVAMTEPVLAHRVVPSAEAMIAGESAIDLIHALLDQIEVPR